MSDLIHGAAITVEHDVEGDLDPYAAGHMIEVDLANTELEMVPALWQASFTNYWSTRVGQVTVARCRKLLAEDLAKRPDNEHTQRKAWLCGAIPPSQVPGEMKKAKADAVNLARKYAEAAAAREARDAAVAASLSAHGIRLVSVKEDHEEPVSYMVPAAMSWHYVLRTASGTEYRFAEQYVWNFGRTVTPEYDNSLGYRPTGACESSGDERVYFLKTDKDGEERCYLPPEEAAAYHWVDLYGEGRKLADQPYG